MKKKAEHCSRRRSLIERIIRPREHRDDSKRSLPLVALIPHDSWLDKEALAAEAAGLPVYRFPVLGREDTQVGPLDPEPSGCGPALVIHREFMLTGEMYSFLYRELQRRYDWTLIVTPEQYECAHYYPNAYPFLKDLSPLAIWTECRGNQVITRDNFLPAAKIVASWGCQSVVIKDYVKSAKDNVDGECFLQVSAHDPVALAERAIELVAARGSRFNRGVVFKEFVPLKKYPDAWGCNRATNEWRCFFGPSGCLLGMYRNSNQRRQVLEPPNVMVQAASKAAKAIGSTYMTVDLAETVDPNRPWIVLEAGDGGVSGPATDQDIYEHWRALAECFGSLSNKEIEQHGK